MNTSIVWILLCGTATALPQAGGAKTTVQDPLNSLGRARATFTATDSDKDSKITIVELRANKLPIEKADFDRQDVDKDGSWSRDEFTLYYRQTLLNAGQRAAADLESEAARIQALRKAKEVQQPKKVDAAKAGVKLTPTVSEQSAKPLDIDERLARAIDELEKKALDRQATREDFQRVRDTYIARATAAKAADPAAEADAAAKFHDALNALETRALEGHATREEFNAVRLALVKRARESVKDGSVDAGKPAELTSVDLEARLQRALDDLEKKAAARQATREDFNQVRDAWNARLKAALATPEPSASGVDAATSQVKPADVSVRLHHAIDELEKKALAGEYSREEFTQLRTNLTQHARAAVNADANGTKGAGNEPEGIEARFEKALADLEAKALARGATREDFNRVREMFVARARHAVKASNAGAGVANADEDAAVSDLSSKLESALARLEKSAESGQLTREQFTEMRTMLVQRATMASKEGTTPVGPAAGRRRTGEAGASETKPAEPAAVPARGGKETTPPHSATNPPAPAPAPAPVTTPPKDEKAGRPNPPHNETPAREHRDG